MENIKRVLVVSTGRSGTTLLMKVLSAHPNVLVRTVFPYETRAMQYFYLSKKKGKQFADYLPLTEGKFTYEPFQNTDEQSKQWRDATSELAFGDLGINASDTYYEVVSNIEHKPNYTHIAEKAVGWSVAKEMLRDVDDTIIIVLYRDPRDVFFSVKSFNRKRGTLSFNEEYGDAYLMKHIVNFYCYAEQQISSNPQRILKVRYEGIITDPDKEIKRLFDILNLPSDEHILIQAKAAALEENNNVRQHKTVESDSKESVARWGREIKEDTAKLFDIYKNELEKIGYMETASTSRETTHTIQI